MATVTDIVNSIISQLQALDPAISAEVGTPERKIIEAVAEQISQASVDIDVLNSQHDLDTMTGARLDQFLGNFGFGRQQPTRATGIVTFSRLTEATNDIVIPRATQVIARQSSLGFAAIIYYTTETAVLNTGQTTIEAAIEASVPGSVANLPAGSITGFGGPQQVPGISAVNNVAPITGGIDGESDAELKVRFKNTIFRNISGTTDQFLALAASQPFVTKANVVGPISRYLEYVQVPNQDDDLPSQSRPIIDPNGLLYPHKRTIAPSTIPYSKFTYDQNFYLSNGELGTTAIFYRPNVDFVFNNPAFGAGDSAPPSGGWSPTSNPTVNYQPNITILNPDLSTDPSGISPGSILLLEHAYMSNNSRNDYRRGILNCIDVFTDGINNVPVVSLETMLGSGYNFTETSSNLLTYRFNFRRTVDGTPPASNNRLHVLYWQPITDLPDTIQIGDNLYYKAKFVKYNLDGSVNGYFFDEAFTTPGHYWSVYENTELYGTIRARNGIEWSSLQPGIPQASSDGTVSVPRIATDLTGSQFVVENYLYDKNIGDLQAIAEKNKQITSDVLVHQARVRYFQLYITIMYSAGVNIDIVNSDIVDQINTFFSSQYFGTVIQMSDLLQVIHNTPGVDNVRWSSDLDNTLHKVLEVSANGSPEFALDEDGTPFQPMFDQDFFLQDNELPALPNTTGTDVTAALVIKKRAQNTWIQR